MRTVGAAFKSTKNLELVTPIFLYEIQVDPATNTFLRWTSFPGDVTFDGITYFHFAVSHDTLKEDATGKVQKSKLKASNVDRQVQSFIDAFDGFRNRTVKITQVFKETLSDPTAFISDTFSITNTLVTESTAIFSLSSELDVFDVRLPKRSIAEAIKGPGGDALRFGGFPTTPSQDINRETE